MTMQQGNLNVNWQSNVTFMGYVQGDEIFALDGQKMGVTFKKYKEVEDGLLKCKNRLIELGEIKIPKTQEQIIQEQSQMLEKQQKLLNELLLKMEGTNGHNATNIEPDSERKTTTSNADGNGVIKKDKPARNK